MTWFWLSIISVLFYSVSTIIQRQIMDEEKSDSVANMVVFQLLIATMIFIYMIISRTSFPNITNVWPLLLLNGVIIAVASLSMFEALKHTDAGEFTILYTLSAPVNLLIVTIFLHELLTWQKILGTALVIASIVIVTKRKAGKKFRIHKGHFYSLLAAVAFGSIFASESYVVSQIGVLQDLLIGFFLPGAFVLLAKPSSIKNIKEVLSFTNLKKMTIFAVLYLVGAITIFMAYTAGGDAGKIYGISNLTVIVTVILGAIFLGERDNLLLKTMATISAFAGVLLLR